MCPVVKRQSLKKQITERGACKRNCGGNAVDAV